jgi:hypothetical protein
MIARVWRGQVEADRAVTYADYVRDSAVRAYRRTPGNLASYVLTRDVGDGRAEVQAFSIWRSWDDLRAFTGGQVDATVCYPEDDDHLIGESTLTHYQVTDLHPPTPVASRRRSRHIGSLRRIRT